jgi:sulfonate transport system permease protein
VDREVGLMSLVTWPPRRRGLRKRSQLVAAALTGALLSALVASLHWTDFRTVTDLVSGDSFLGDLLLGTIESVARLVAGLAIGTLAGLFVGGAMGASAFLDRLLGSVVDPLRQVPLFGWVPLLGLWAGLGEGSKVAFVALAVSYVMVIAVNDGMRATPPALREVCDTVALGTIDRLRFLVIPAALPAFFAGLRVAIAVAWSAEVGAEILMSSAPGLGSVIWGAREVGRLDLLVAGTVAIGALGVLSSVVFRIIESRAIRWR